MRFNRKLLKRLLQLKEAALVKYSKFHHLDKLIGPNVLVLSPHPDDDVFGCGGTLVKHIQQGHHVYVVYLCQGDKGITNKSSVETAEIRKKESLKAATILGIPKENLFYLAQKDEQLTASKLVLTKLNALIVKLTPNIIYLPSFTDHHSDHFQTNIILKELAIKDVWVAGYEIWTPHIPNRLVDISRVMDKKLLAIQAHQSQLVALDYLNAIKGLNQYRACLYPKRKYQYAESFILAKKKDYFELMNREG